MYCPSCGVQLAQSLSYCNHCGANLVPLTDQDKGKKIETTIGTLVWVIVGTTITLLAMALGALVLMKDGKIDDAVSFVRVLCAVFRSVFVTVIVTPGRMAPVVSRTIPVSVAVETWL